MRDYENDAFERGYDMGVCGVVNLLISINKISQSDIKFTLAAFGITSCNLDILSNHYKGFDLVKDLDNLKKLLLGFEHEQKLKEEQQQELII